MSNNLTTNLERKNSISSNIYQTKNLEDLDMMDSFLFNGITENTSDAVFIAQTIIRRVCGHTVPNLIVETEKQLKGLLINNRGIRMDLLATEKNDEKILRFYDIEPNKYREDDLPHRSRYYQSLMDSKLLQANTPFKDLPDSVSIWILPYDPFGDERMIYTIKNMVVENPQLRYNDGVTKIFLYTKGIKGGSRELKELLIFMEHTTNANAVDEELQEIQKIVDRLKTQNDVKERYMTLQEVIDYEKRDSYEQGIELGRSEGIRATVATCKELQQDKSQTRLHLINQFQLTEDKADKYMELYW